MKTEATRSALMITLGAALAFAPGLVKAQSYHLQELGTLSVGAPTYAYGINAAGQVWGCTWAGDSSGYQATVLWSGSSIQDLGTLGGHASCGIFERSGSKISASGQVTGRSYLAGSTVWHAFRWNGTSIQDLGTLGGTYSEGHAINASGQVTGDSYLAGDATGRAFMWDGTSMQNLGTLGGGYSAASSINDAGLVTGSSDTGGTPNASHAFLWDGTSMQDLGTLGGTTSRGDAINATGQVGGISLTAGNSVYDAFLWDGTSMQDLGNLGGSVSQVMAINASGQVAGDAVLADGTFHAFLWNGSLIQDLGTLGGKYSDLSSMNASGQAVGWASIADGTGHAFLWNGTSLQDLNDLIDPKIPGLILQDATGINDLGQIVANGYDTLTGAHSAYLLSPVTVTDTTPPVIQSTVTGTRGNGGWYVSDVQVAWTVTDAESAISTSTGCDSTSVTVDTAGTIFTCSATSAGGPNTASVTVKRDATAPSATAGAGPPPNQYGWRRQNVTVSFTGTDAMSGGVTCDPNVVLSSEGADQSASGRCYDAAGNQSALATATGISIDKTAPTITISSPMNGATYTRNQSVVASYVCDDALSGVATCAGTVASGQPINTSKKVKNAKFTVMATDKADHTAKQTVTYTVN